jgi:CspA family cold shock protein
MADKRKGTVKKWMADKGYGFIAMDDGEDVFVHRTAIQDGGILKDGERVTFELVKGGKGPRAEGVVRG